MNVMVAETMPATVWSPAAVTETLAAAAETMPMPVVWSPTVQTEVVDAVASTMTAYDVRTAWKFGGYGDETDFPGLGAALLQMIEGLRLWQLLELFGDLFGDAWRSLTLSALFPRIARPVLLYVAPESVESAAGAHARHDRARSRCVPLRGPNHARDRLSRVGVDMST